MSALEQTVPQGYKQTLAGIIPEDWETGYLGDSAQFVGSGKTNTKNKGDFQLYGSTGVIGSCALPEYTGPSILVARVGANAGKLGFADGEYGVSDNTIIIRLHKNCNLKYFQYWLTRRNLNSLVFGSGQPLITGSQLKELLLPLPKIEEQTVIANALSDVDALLTELEKLTAKKQAIKTATMQQLLTGKTRLPQFSTYTDGEKKGQPKGTKPSELGKIPEDWDVASFGELFEQSISRKSLKANMTATFIGMQDVSESARLIKQTPVNISKVKSGFTYFERDDVLVAKITPCFENGKGCHTKQLDTEHGFGSTEFHVLRAKLNADSDFIYFWTTREIFRQELEREMVGSAGHRRVPFSALQNYKIPCPDSKEEQTAIATILSDMDNEIQTLEQRLAKTRQIKQGMMQELLTGRTRLPFDKEQ